MKYRVYVVTNYPREFRLIELVNRIHQFKAEVQNLEVKSAHIDCPKKLYDTLSSFSNQDGGGILIFGLDEKQNFATVGI